MTTEELKVTSHVGRDLLAAASFFRDPALVAWEYVVNSLQYHQRGIPPRVQVSIKPVRKIIEISDNGRGMNAADLAHFFKMHGENPERAVGRIGRGKFGTGKSAAFGIARRLRVDTRQDGLRNVVELDREVIDSSHGDDIPIEWLTRDESTDLPNGTTITISEMALPRKITIQPIIERIERQLKAFRGTGAEVAVNDHVCEFRMPPVAETYSFDPSPSQARVIGPATLTVWVSSAPLTTGDQGIVVTAGRGNQVAVETAGIERKEFGNYLFGEVDVPALEMTDTPIEPYDSSRSLMLNPNHPVAAVLIPFIGVSLEKVRSGLVRREREARKSEQARRLQEQADGIAELLNDDYRKIQKLLQEIRTASASKGTVTSAFGDSGVAGVEEGEWVEGTSEPGSLEETGRGGSGSGEKGREAPQITARGERDPHGSDSVDPAGGSSKRRRKPQGGFRVRFDNMGEEEHRSRYDPTTLSILINLDHPVVSAALGEGGVQEQDFRRLSYEIAFTEYSLALSYERVNLDPDLPADDLIYDMREDLNRISRAAATLYR
jgi:hypothetical protein